MTSLLLEPFFQRSLLIGVLACIACGVMGAFVVVKRMTYVAGSISHATFGGIGLAFFLGWSPTVGALVVSLAAAVILALFRYYFNQREDALVSALWAVGMAVGILLVYLSKGYVPDLFGYLFGNILIVGTSDVLALFGICVVVCVLVTLLFRAFQAISFDETFANAINLPVGPLYALLLCLVAATIVLLIRVVGVIMVVALLTLPSSAAAVWANRLSTLIGMSIGFGLFAVIVGLFSSYFLNVPPGPIIILFALGVYLMALLFKSIRDKRAAKCLKRA